MTSLIRLRPSAGSLARFRPAHVEAGRAHGLRADHPALVEARTIFPSTVHPARWSPALLVGGHNNPKLGARITKGLRKGWPIYHLTLEERATCPRSCALWAGCYGNAMHLARRHHPGRQLELRLVEEVAALQRKHPRGFLVRLHTLGDFYSAFYVEVWARLLDACPALHVFGFTARSEHEDDEESRAVARALKALSTTRWDRFAIRFSRRWAQPQGSVVVDEPPVGMFGVVACPAQTGRTEACATCGLCWAEGARDKAIAFLRHGMKRNTGRRVARG